MTLRHRERNGITSVPTVEKADIYWRTGDNCNAGLTWYTYAQNSSTQHIGKRVSMTDEVIPNFHKLSQEGRVFMNGMSSNSMEITAGSGTTPEMTAISSSCSGAQLYKKRYRYPLTGASVGRLTSGFEFLYNSDGSIRPYNSLVSGSDLNAAITEASTATLSNRGKANNNLWETLAESNKALGLVPGMTRNALKTISKNSSLIARSKASGSAYLAYRYGLRPLMLDLEAIQKGLLKKVGKLRQTTRSQVTLTESKVETFTGNYGGAFYYDRLFEHQEVLNVRAMSLDEYVASVASNIGFTTKGLATLPWELLPYSFVVDWFANIGDFFGSLVPAFGYNQLGSCLVIDGTLTSNYTALNSRVIAANAYTQDTPVSGSCTRIWTSKRRSTLPLRRGLVVKSDFRLNEATRAADAIALILQKIK